MQETKMFALAEVKSTESDNPHGEFEVILSAPTLDRDGEVIDAKVFEPLPDHITFDIDHGMSTATTVASGMPYYDGDLLKVKGTFSSIPRAQEVRTLVAEGHIRTTSVAFMSAEREEKDGVTHITRAELLNGAFVPIPSNRDALVLSSKSFSEMIDSRATKADRLQSIHDLAVQNGADCSGKSAPTKSADPDAEPAKCVSCGAEQVLQTTPTDSSTEAPVTPSDEDGKSPASEVVEAYRLMAQAALLATR